MPFFMYYQELNNDVIQSWQKQKSSHAWPAGTQNVATTCGEKSWRQGFESRCVCSGSPTPWRVCPAEITGTTHI